jgi:hypothetical protein
MMKRLLKQRMIHFVSRAAYIVRSQNLSVTSVLSHSLHILRNAAAVIYLNN